MIILFVKDNSKKIEDNSKRMEDNSKEIKENMEAVKEELSKQIAKNNEKTNKKMEEQMTGIRREISEVHEKWNQMSQEIEQRKEDVNTRINNMEEDNLICMEVLQKETQENITRVETCFVERCETMDKKVNDVRGQVIQNKAKIDELRDKELLIICDEMDQLGTFVLSLIHI